MRHLVVTAFLTLLMLVNAISLALGQPVADKENAAKEVKKRELFRLSNAELLDEAKALLSKSSEAFRAELRGLATAETQFVQARQQTAKLETTAQTSPPKNSKENAPDAKAAAAASKAQVESLKRRLDRLVVEKSVLEQVSARVDSAQSAAAAFANVLDDLDGYVLELSLRLKDGTLDDVPSHLTAAGLNKSKDGVQEEQKRLQERARTVRQELDSGRLTLEKARQELLQAEAEYALAARKHGREMNRQEAEKQFADQPFDELLARLEALHEEEVGLRGTFNLALRRFRVRDADAAALRKELSDLKLPAVKIPAVSRAEDVDQAIKAIESQIDHGRRLLDRLQQFSAALGRVVEQGSICEGDAAVLEEHLFKMQILAGVVVDRTNKDTKLTLPKGTAPGVQVEAIRKLNESVSEVLAATQTARKESQELLARLKDAQASTNEDQTRLATLRQTQEATRQLLQWEEKLRTLAPAAAVDVFQATNKELQAKLSELPKQRSTYENALTSLVQVRSRLEGLKDPLFRQVEKEKLTDRQQIADELRKWAGLERVEQDAAKPLPGAATKADTPTQEPGGLNRAQQLLSTWARTADEQEQKRQELLKANAEVRTHLDSYANSLGEVRRLAMQQHATAIDLKKRLGRGELEAGLIPDGVAEALKSDLIAKLNTDAAGLINARTPLQEENDRLEKPNKELSQARSQVKDLLLSIGRRIDLLDELGRLETDAQKERQRSDSEVKRIERTAADRQSGDDSLLEFLLSLDNSPGAKQLTELMQSYYRELIDLEERRQVLESQKKKIDDLVEAAQKESGQAALTIPLLQKFAEDLADQREEALLLVRIRLRPEEADELLKAHHARTERTLTRPPPVADKDKPALVESAVKEIFESLVREEAARRWVALLAERLSPAGIDAEVGRYQDKLGAVDAALGAAQRRVHFLTGADKSDTKGEITRVRAERTSIRQEGVLRIASKIAIVLAVAFILPRLASWLIVRLGRRRGELTAHGQLVLSLISVFIKLIVWILALVIILSTLGFDVTAILAALGIGGLAIGLAAQETIADIIGGVMIFIERPFSIDDTVSLGGAEPAKVVGLTWRTTRLRTPLGGDLTVPNREVTKATIRNLTREGRTFDSVVFPLQACWPIEQNLALMEEALNECQSVSREGQRGVTAQTVELNNGEPFVNYTLWWHVHEYERRNLIRAEVLERVSTRLRGAGVLASGR